MKKPKFIKHGNFFDLLEFNISDL